MPRISVECPPRLMNRLQRCFPWGTQSAAIRRLCEILCDHVEQNGIDTIAKLITGTYNPLEEPTKRERMKS